jgi:hypothetical protein
VLPDPFLAAVGRGISLDMLKLFSKEVILTLQILQNMDIIVVVVGGVGRRG